jgi:hypothetical protein
MTTNGVVFVASAGGSQANIAYSYDGNTWFNSTSGTTIFLDAGATIGCSGFMFVAAAGSISGSTTGVLAYSYDGINWTKSTQGSALLASLGNYVGIRGFTWNGTYWIGCIASGSNFGIIYSTDGITWTRIANSYYAIKVASRHTAPFIGDNISGNFQASPTGPTGLGSPSSYFLNTTSRNLFQYRGTGWTGIYNSNNYTPAVAGNWTGAAPTTLTGALDRVAAALVSLGRYA